MKLFKPKESKPSAVRSWTSPKTQRGLPSKIRGKGFFATAPIAKGEPVFVKMGRLIDTQSLLVNLDVINGAEQQVDENLYIAPLTHEEMLLSMVYCNHSCEPNLGFQGLNLGVALRDIAAGEELTLDYATFHNDDIMQFECHCGTPSCRQHITGRDWQIPELQQKYDGYFSWFLQQKIDQLKK